MEFDEICNEDAAPGPPHTPPREDAGGNENPSENNDNAKENEESHCDDEDEEESASVDSQSAGGIAGNGQSSETGMPISSLRPKSMPINQVLSIATQRMEESCLVEWPSIFFMEKNPKATPTNVCSAIFCAGTTMMISISPIHTRFSASACCAGRCWRINLS